MEEIYLDNNASTQVDPAVTEAMLPFFSKMYANPSSGLHAMGHLAAEAVRKARSTIADCLRIVCPEDILFTSGATESNNLAIKGIVQSSHKTEKHIITSVFEHESILAVCKELEEQGVSVTYIPTSKDGFVSISDIEASLTKNTVLVSIMAANNEIGTIQPIQQIGDLLAGYGIPFHTDAVQLISTGYMKLDRIKADLVTFSAHKIYGAKGVGGLFYNSDKLRLAPQMLGGKQQFGIRSGTFNVPSIVGMATAFSLLERLADEEFERILFLRNRMLDLLSCGEDVLVNGSMTERIPSNLNITLPGIPALALAKELPRIMFSAGSACSSTSGEASHVLRAIGVSNDMISCSIRLSLGRFTTEAEIVEAAQLIRNGINTIRERQRV